MIDTEYTQLRANFMRLYLAGATEEQIRKELKISSSQFLGLRAFITPDEREKRRLARRSIREKEYRMKAVPLAGSPFISPSVQRLNRSELLAHIASLLRCNGIYSSMKSYDHCSNAKLVEIRDRLMRNRSDKYQYSERGD